MTVFIVLGFLLLSGQIYARPQNTQKTLQMLHDLCVDETGVDEKFIDMSNKGNFMKDPELKCYMKCLLTTAQIMDKDGEIDVDLFLSAIPEEYLSIMEPILRGCGTVKGVDDCDTAFLTNKCWYSMRPKVMAQKINHKWL